MPSKFDDAFDEYAARSFKEDLIKAHLRFYTAIRALLSAEGTITSSPNPNHRALITLSVARFYVWLKRVLAGRKLDPPQSLSAEELPPLDVLLVLYAYMLCPHHLHQDSLQFEGLKNVGSFPLALLVSPRSHLLVYF